MYRPELGVIPIDDFSRSLLITIPRKVFAWLDNLNEDLSRPGTARYLSWSCEEDGGFICYSTGTELPVIIGWTGTVTNPDVISSNIAILESITYSLSFFTELEHKIYSELEFYQHTLVQVDNDPVIGSTDD